MNTVSDYLGFGLNIVDEKAQEFTSLPDVRLYYNKKTGSEDKLAVINQQYSIEGSIKLAKDTNTFISGIHLIGKYGKGISTAVPSNDNLYKAFKESAEAKIFDDKKVTYVWVGSHADLDKVLINGDSKYTTDNYAMSIIKKMNNGFAVIDISKQQIMDMFSKYDLGEGSITGMVLSDGREVLTGTKEESIFNNLSYYNDAVTGEAPSGYYYETYNNTPCIKITKIIFS